MLCSKGFLRLNISCACDAVMVGTWIVLFELHEPSIETLGHLYVDAYVFTHVHLNTDKIPNPQIHWKTKTHTLIVSTWRRKCKLRILCSSSIDLSIDLPIYLSVYLSIYLPIHLSIYLSICLNIYIYMYIYMYMLCVYIYMCISTCKYMYIYI